MSLILSDGRARPPCGEGVELPHLGRGGARNGRCAKCHPHDASLWSGLVTPAFSLAGISPTTGYVLLYPRRVSRVRPNCKAQMKTYPVICSVRCCLSASGGKSCTVIASEWALAMPIQGLASSRPHLKKSAPIMQYWSGRQDSNLRPSGPKPDALPGCATPRPGSWLRAIRWWARQDSNPRPSRYERPALTAELQAPAIVPCPSEDGRQAGIPARAFRQVRLRPLFRPRWSA